VPLDKLNIVSEIFKSHQSIIACDANKFIANKDFTSLKTVCDSKGINTDESGDTLSLKIKSFIGVNLICSKEIEKYFENSFTEEEFAILNTNGDYCYNDLQNAKLIFNEQASSEFRIVCTNIYHYFKLYNFLKSEEFADHHNDANSEIVIYSSAKGIFKIQYTAIPTVEKAKEFSSSVLKLIEIATPIQLRFFFKNSLFTFSNGTGVISINEILEKSQDIIAATKRDFELVSKQFDFDKFRDSLYKEKEKYFTNIRDIVNKIFSQAIGIPISISATVFATYKVSDDTLMLLLVWLSFILYAVFYIKIQWVYKGDIQELKTDFTNDFAIIKSKSGLPENLIQTEKEKIERKISSSLTMIDMLIGVVIGLGILVSWYIFYEVGKSETFCLIKWIFGTE
jgi:hypothetical protein